MKKILVTIPVNEQQENMLRAAAQPNELVFCANADVTREMVAGASALLGNVSPALLKDQPNLEWVQLHSAGTDGYPEALPETCVLTNSTGAFGTAISEHIIGMLLGLMKNLYAYRDAQPKAEWVSAGYADQVMGKTLMILGAGDIGEATALRMRPFGVKILAVRRHGDIPCAFADETYGVDQLDSILPQVDIVMMSLPQNASTRSILSRERIFSLRKGAYITNVGRGSAIDQDALVDALKCGQIRGAALDVTVPEPLPSDHPLWSIPSCAITPHVSGQSYLPATLNRVLSISAENLTRYAREEALENQVDKATGYTKK